MHEKMTLSRILVLGGVRSGKSSYAQHIVGCMWKRPLFLATAEVLDSEMKSRIETHKKTRGRKWTCIEEPLDIDRIIRDNPCGADGILVDCLTIWLSNVLLKEGPAAIERRKHALIDAVRAVSQNIILVSNEVGMGIVPENELGRTFRDCAGRLNQELAAEVDTVVFVVAGLPMLVKGCLPDVRKK